MRPIIGSGGGGSGWPEVNYYADLPASPALNDIYAVLNSSGIWPTNYHASGIYRWNGVSWVKFDDLQELLKNVTLTDVSANKLIGSDGTKVQEVTIGAGLSLVSNIIENTNPSPTPPGGSSGQMQYNDDGVFGGDDHSFYDDAIGVHDFGNVGNGNYTEIEEDGTISFHGDATVWKDVIADIMPFSARALANYQGGFCNDEKMGYWLFDATVESCQLEWSIELPHDYKEGTNLFLHVHFSPTTTYEGERAAIVWDIGFYQANVRGQDHATNTNFQENGPLSFPIQYDIRGGMPAWEHLKTTNDREMGVIDGKAYKISNVLKGYITLNRETTYNDELAFLYLDIHYEVDTVGSREERAKGNGA